MKTNVFHVVILAGIVAALSVGASPAQTVSRVQGSQVTLSIGSAKGVRVGMTGKLCTRETVSGKEIDVCPTGFTVTSVAPSSSVARISKGNQRLIAPGFKVIFDQSLVPVAKSISHAPPRKGKTADELRSEGDHLFDQKNWAAAKARFEELLKRFPTYSDSKYAKTLIGVCTEKLAEEEQAKRAALERAEARAKQEQDRKEAGVLVGQARRLKLAGAWKQVEEKASEALSRDSSNQEATKLLSDAISHLGAPVGTVIDQKTGLMWTKKDNERDIDWDAAESYCSNLTLGGFSNWRLPTEEELRRLYNKSASDDCGTFHWSLTDRGLSSSWWTDSSNVATCHPRLGIDLSEPWVWSSTKMGSSLAWAFDFYVGSGTHFGFSHSDHNRALCVRRSWE